MPTYEFRCPDGHDFEKFYRSIGGAPVEVQCPTCGKVAARQLSAGGGLLFKGSGFYITDYGKDGKKSQAAVPAKGDSAKPAGDAAASKSESGSGDKSSAASTGDSGSKSAASESKPAAAPEKKPKASE
jgi:putative FmdB family regulatory protein